MFTRKAHGLKALLTGDSQEWEFRTNHRCKLIMESRQIYHMEYPGHGTTRQVAEDCLDKEQRKEKGSEVIYFLSTRVPALIPRRGVKWEKRAFPQILQQREENESLGREKMERHDY